MHSTESLKDYLKRNLNNQHDCDAEIIVANRSHFDPTTICGDQFFLPMINSKQHILDLFLLFQFLDFQTAIFLTETTLRFENHVTISDQKENLQNEKQSMNTSIDNPAKRLNQKYLIDFKRKDFKDFFKLIIDCSPRLSRNSITSYTL